MNVVTTQPGVGDILCRDESGGYRFIQLDTFQGGTFPSAWETLGVVVWRKGNQVKVVSKRNEERKWMDVYPYVVTGYRLDGTEHTARLRLRNLPGASTYYDFIYSATTDEAFVWQLRQFLTSNGLGDWSAYLQDGNVILQCDSYEKGSGLDSPSTQAVGISIDGKVRSDLPRTPLFHRRCGNVGNGVWHAARAKAAFREDNPAASTNPASDVSSVPSSPVCWPAFAGKSQYQSDHCLWLRQRYCADPAHPTFDEWKGYIAGQKIVAAMYNGTAPEWRWETAKESVEELKGLTYQDGHGETRPLFPAARKAALAFGGRGYVPSQLEISEAFGELNYGVGDVAPEDYDPITRALRAVSGRAINLQNVSVWGAGSNGSVHERHTQAYMDQGYLYTPAYTAVFARYDLSELNDD